MKKLLLAFLLGAIVSVNLNAQCVPDTTIQGVVVPPAGSKIDTTNGFVVLPYAYVSQNYMEAIHFKIPKDTTFPGIGSIPINYVKLDAILGLPSVFTLTCSPSNCTFPGDSYGCAEMTGIPTTPDSISLRVAIEYNITISGLPTPIKDTLEGYYLVIKAQPIGLAERNMAKATARVFPNPAKENVFLNFEANGGKTASLQISSIIGTLVYDRTFTSVAGENKVEINTSNFKPGIYMYSLKVDNKNISGRFTISR